LENIVDAGAAADVEMGTRLDEHVCCGDYIRERRFTRVVAGEPDCDRDVVGLSTEGDREKAVDAEQQLSAAIVVRVDIRLGPQRRKALQRSIDVCKDAVSGSVRGDVLAEPFLGECSLFHVVELLYSCSMFNTASLLLGTATSRADRRGQRARRQKSPCINRIISYLADTLPGGN
jgi:hypothetical protein